MAKKRKHAYKQAPWRRQLRSMGLFILPIVAIALVVSLHLTVSARSASAGLQIMDMHYEEEEILRKIANQRIGLAWISSYGQMQKQAEKLGFEVLPQESFHYMVINGYQGQEAVLLAPPPGSDQSPTPLVNEFYQQSLMDWFIDTFLVNAGQTGKIQQ